MSRTLRRGNRFPTARTRTTNKRFKKVHIDGKHGVKAQVTNRQKQRIKRHESRSRRHHERDEIDNLQEPNPHVYRKRLD